MLTMSVKENVSLTYLPFVYPWTGNFQKEVDEKTDDIIEKLSIRPVDRNIKTR